MNTHPLPGDANSAKYSDLSRYTLTVGEASSIMATHRCKYPSSRKVQRLCKEEVIDCYKLSSTRNGQPISEWLVNQESLLRRIKSHEPKLDYAVASGNASQALSNNGDANPMKTQEDLPAASLPANEPGGAVDLRTSEIGTDTGDVIDPPESPGDAIGEPRTVGSLLIELAKLSATIEGYENLLGEVRGDKNFLREELQAAREGRKDVTKIAERMLEALETMAIGGRLNSTNAPQRMTTSIDRSGDNDKSNVESFGV